MGLLDGLFGGSKTQKVEQSLPAWQLPYTKFGMGEALRLYQGGGGYQGGTAISSGTVPTPGAAPAPAPAPQVAAPGAGIATPAAGGLTAQQRLESTLAGMRGGSGGRDTIMSGGQRIPINAPGTGGAAMAGYGAPGVPGMAGPGAPGTGGAPAPGVPGAPAVPPPTTTVGGMPVTSQTTGPGAVRAGSKVYQGATVADPSGNTQAGMDAIRANAGGIDPRSSVNALNSALNGNNFGLQDTAQGKFLNANPYLDRNIEAATRGITQNFRQSTAPGIESAAASRGRLGSGWDATNRANASQALAGQLADTESGMRMANYQTERQNQIGAQQTQLQQRLQAAGLLTDTLDTANISGLRGGQALLGAGGYMDSRNDTALQNEARRYEATAMEPEQDLDRYIGRTSGNVGSTQSTPISRDVGGALLGGAGVGAQLGSMIPALGGGWGAALGAGLSFLSDEGAKEKRKPARTGGMLEALESMPIDEWEYKPGMGDGGGRRHVGPMAQDFRRATGKGDGRSIPVVDAQGVTMGAVQELAKRLKRIERRAA